MGSSWKQIGIPLACLIGALFFLVWPALFNGQPFIFPDTSSYIRGFDAAATKATGHVTQWSPSTAAVPARCAQGSGGARLSSVSQKVVLSGRSIYYGAILYLGDMLGGGWFSVILQALAVMLAIGLTIYEFFGMQWRFFFWTCAGLALVTPLAFFASYLMPDIFAGIAILALANMFVSGETMPFSRLAIWTALLAVAALVHASIILIAIFVLVLAVLYRLIRKSAVPWHAVFAVTLAIAIGFLGEAAFDFAVAKSLGAPPIRPPQITARLLADGTGAAYVKAKCPAAGFAVCKYASLPPVRNPDDFLWSENPKKGGFVLADPATKRALGNEQYRFALAVFLYDPAGQISASLKNTFAQVTMFRMEEFASPAKLEAQTPFYECHLPVAVFQSLLTSKFWQDKVPVTTLSYIFLVFTLASLGFIVWYVFFAQKMGASSRPKLEAFAMVVLLGLFANAAICGSLSTPHDRYQMRVIWLLPFVSVLLLRETAQRRRLTGSRF